MSVIPGPFKPDQDSLASRDAGDRTLQEGLIHALPDSACPGSLGGLPESMGAEMGEVNKGHGHDLSNVEYSGPLHIYHCSVNTTTILTILKLLHLHFALTMSFRLPARTLWQASPKTATLPRVGTQTPRWRRHYAVTSNDNRTAIVTGSARGM